MKVKTWVEFAQEVDVNVSMDDIRSALSMEASTTKEALQLVNCCASAIKAVSDQMILEMNDAQRNVIASFFREQAERFMPNPESSGVQAAQRSKS